jgi:hypothetical protein
VARQLVSEKTNSHEAWKVIPLSSPPHKKKELYGTVRPHTIASRGPGTNVVSMFDGRSRSHVGLSPSCMSHMSSSSTTPSYPPKSTSEADVPASRYIRHAPERPPGCDCALV